MTQHVQRKAPHAIDAEHLSRFARKGELFVNVYAHPADPKMALYGTPQPYRSMALASGAVAAYRLRVRPKEAA